MVMDVLKMTMLMMISIHCLLLLIISIQMYIYYSVNLIVKQRVRRVDMLFNIMLISVGKEL